MVYLSRPPCRSRPHVLSRALSLRVSRTHSISLPAYTHTSSFNDFFTKGTTVLFLGHCLIYSPPAFAAIDSFDMGNECRQPSAEQRTCIMPAAAARRTHSKPRKKKPKIPKINPKKNPKYLNMQIIYITIRQIICDNRAKHCQEYDR